MTSRRLGYLFLALGVAATATSLLADALRSGSPGIQAAQVLGLELGVTAAAAGLWLAFVLADRPLSLRGGLRTLAARLANLPNAAWVLLGFALVFLAFVIYPMFLQSAERMVYFNKYLPDQSPIGGDLLLMTDLIQAWLAGGESPYGLQFYPPLAYVVFAPLLLVGHATAYRIVTGLTLLGFAMSMLVVCSMQRRKSNALTLLIAATGLISYGFQFELERGQYNVIAMTLVLMAIAIFHSGRGWRPFAYVLFTVGVQLKAYPAVFALMLIDDWQDWKSTLRRMAGLALLNFAALFVGGPRLFSEFFGAITGQLFNPSMNYWSGNHSISNFVFGLGFSGYGLIREEALEGWRQATPWIEALLLGLLAASFVIVVVRVRRDRGTGPDPFLMLVCTLAALMIPISNDYKLSILPVPMAMALAGLPEVRAFRRQWPPAALVLLASAAYAALLIPFRYKPPYLENSFPLLLLILVAMTALSMVRQAPAAGAMQPAESAGKP